MTVVVEVYDDERVLIKSDQPFRDKELIKTLPGAKYSVQDHRWFAPLTWSTCRALRGIFESRLEVGDKLKQWAWQERTERIDPALGLRNAFDAKGDDDLYPFQRAGVQFLKYAEQALLCDEMGTGKTVQAIRALKGLADDGESPFPCIVVAPNSMVLTWKKEFNRWWPAARITVIKGSAKKRRDQIADDDTDVWVINYEGLRSHSKLAGYGSIKLKQCVVCNPLMADVPANAQSRCEHCKKELNETTWKTIIVDEAHRMKDPKAKQTRAVWSLRTDDTEYVYGLTGTAIANAPHDLWPALHLLNPTEWPARTKYIERYCLAAYNPWGMTVIGLRDDHKQEFFDIVDPRMRRMPKDAVLPFLPKKTYSERFVQMTTQQARAYKQMQDGLIALLDGDNGEGGIAVATNPLVQLTRLTQFASAYAEVNDEGEVRLSMPSNKVATLLEILEDMGNEPAVVFAQSRQLIELACEALDKKGISFAKIVGGQKAEEREAQKDAFQAGHKRVILCTIAAGGVGITLTKASVAIFLQRSWSMVDNSQAEDRVHRIGSEVHDKIEIIDIISEETIEERQREVLEQKGERLEEVMRDKATVLRMLLGKRDADD